MNGVIIFIRYPISSYRNKTTALRYSATYQRIGGIFFLLTFVDVIQNDLAESTAIPVFIYPQSMLKYPAIT